MLKSNDSMAASASIPAGVTVNTTTSPFSSLNDGDTLYIYGTLKVNNDYTVLQNKSVTIIVDGSGASLLVLPNEAMYLGASSQIILSNGGLLISSASCQASAKIYIGSTEVTSCAGSTGVPSFDDVNSAGGVSGVGMLPVSWLDVGAPLSFRRGKLRCFGQRLPRKITVTS